MARLKSKKERKMKTKINRVMLALPRYTLFKNDVRRCVAPMGLAYLGAYLEREGYKVKILDVQAEGFYNIKQDEDFVTFGLNDEEIEGRISDYKPDFIGVSCLFSAQAENTKHFLSLIKSIDSTIITTTGGCHPTFALEDMLDYADYVVSGEGELPTSQLLTALNNSTDISRIGGLSYKRNGKKYTNQDRQYIKDLDSLPFPARHLLDMELYFKINSPHNPYAQGHRVIEILTSRGCTAKCIFCSSTNFWGNRYRARSSQNVISEIKELKEKYSIDEIQFSDDNLTANKRRAIEIMEGIKDLGLMWCAPNGVTIQTLDDELLEKAAQSGCYQMSFAIESGNQEVVSKIIRKPINLNKVKPLVKKAQQLGIKIHAFAISGFPGETIEQMYDTYNFVKDCEFDSASFFIATPLVGSELLEICEKGGYLGKERKYDKLLYKIGNITTSEFTAGQVQELAEHFNREYNKYDTREKKLRQKGKY